jgi:hypothetical protein
MKSVPMKKKAVMTKVVKTDPMSDKKMKVVVKKSGYGSKMKGK